MSIKLQSKDGKIFEVDLQVAKQSGVIKEMLEMLGDEDEPLPLEVDGAMLEKVIEWCTHEQNKPVEKRFHNEVEYKKEKDDWTIQYFQVETEMKCSLLNVANYLNIESLIGWASFSLYVMMDGKTPEEIRRTFNMPNDLTATELAKIEKGNQF